MFFIGRQTLVDMVSASGILQGFAPAKERVALVLCLLSEMQAAQTAFLCHLLLLLQDLGNW